MEIRTLLESDDRARFDCGDPDLNDFFRRYAGQNQFKHGVSTTYVASEGGHVIGFITVCGGEIRAAEVSESIRKSLPRYPLPVLRVARYAVDLQHRSKGVGSMLLAKAFEVAMTHKAASGCLGLVVDAKPGAVDFYMRKGFLRFHAQEQPETTRMFIDLTTIIDGLE